MTGGSKHFPIEMGKVTPLAAFLISMMANWLALRMAANCWPWNILSRARGAVLEILWAYSSLAAVATRIWRPRRLGV